MKLKVLFHDSCFDGAASAAIFSRFYQERINPDALLEYEGLQHKAGGSAIDPAVFTGDENVIVDFRYSQDPRLSWWFDHHQSAFQMPGDEAHFRADTSGRKFHDPHRKSNTRYMTDVLVQRFGFNDAPLAELLHWAELIDGAQFQSPNQAVELAEPALKLMTVIEANKDPAWMLRMIAALQTQSLAEIVAQDWVQRPLLPLLERHQRAIQIVRNKIQYQDGIATFDIADDGLDSINKFISYYLYPDARYTVWVGKGSSRAKISLGSNPWRPELREHNLSKIAERYGGGGHPVVAAISFQPDQLDRARQVAAEILAELKSPPA
ncbi:MAG: DHH family phosphoesterase [Myxococcota bacterium]|nr:DHH family phosphoesterase [Myxococcota bacterium]